MWTVESRARYDRNRLRYRSDLTDEEWALVQPVVARVCRSVSVEIVRRCDRGKFVVLPKRWSVERTIAWLNRCRRLGKDWECLSQNALAFLRWASIRMMLRRLCRN